MVNEGLIPSPEDDKKRRSVIHMLQRVTVLNLSHMILDRKVMSLSFNGTDSSEMD